MKIQLYSSVSDKMQFTGNDNYSLSDTNNKTSNQTSEL